MLWQMKKDVVGVDLLYVWYEADVVLSDHDDDGMVAKSTVKRLCSSTTQRNGLDRREVEGSIPIRLGESAVDGSQKVDKNQRKLITRNIDGINTLTSLRHMKDTPGISRYVHYIYMGFTFFPFHIKDDHLSSIYFLVSRLRKVWYIIQTKSMTSSGTFVANGDSQPRLP